MEPSVYLETSVVSYLAAEPSRDLVVAAHQRIASQWWSQRTRFRLFVSELVIQEAAAGDPGLAGRRLERIAGLGVLKIRDDAVRLAEALVDQGPIPVKASADALHIALAAAHGIDFVLTWNMRHIANAAMRVGIERTCRANGFEPPVLCTPRSCWENSHAQG